MDLNDIVDRFESEWSTSSDLNEYLPDPAASNFMAVLCELVRVDLELRWNRGEKPLVEHYLEQFPNAAWSKRQITGIAFEEYRLRHQHEQPASPGEFSDRLGVNVSNWPIWNAESETSQTHRLKDRQKSRIRFPKVGELFHEFELIGILGQGAFGCVYLARQCDLANRFIAVKVTEISDNEPQILARLQHTNIVPIHSLRREDELQSICMPFLGLVTLRDLIRQTDAEDNRSRSAQELISTVAVKRASTVVALSSQTGSDDSQIKEVLRSGKKSVMPAIAGMNFQDTILWMTSRIAAGLAFAHERGVVHGDMKPGNVLISDDGQPLILDFHLSTRPEQSVDSLLVGGTLPYMSAGHLRSLATNQGVDPSCDIFSVGVMMYEALTGQLPYPDRGVDEQAIQKMICDRASRPRSVRDIVPEIAPGAASIVQRCLDPVDSYKTAAEVQFDIERHLCDLPLKFAPNPSVTERFKKWARRHPRLSSVSVMTLIGLILTAMVAGAVGTQLRRAARIQAVQKSVAFVDELEHAKQPLTIGSLNSGLLKEKAALLVDLIAQRSTDGSEHRALLNRLPEDIRESEINALIDSKYWLAVSLFTRGINAPQTPEQRELFRQAIDELGSARSLSDSNTTALAQLQSDIYRRLGDPETADKIRNSVDDWVPEGSLAIQDQLLRAAEFRRKGDESRALGALKQLASEHTNSFPVWLMMGHAYRSLGELERAEAAYTVCIGLESESPWGYFCRGKAFLEQHEYAAAKQDFDVAIQLDESDPAGYLNRALAFRGLGEFEAAISDLTSAIDMGSTETRAFHLRYQMRKQLGQLDEANQDLTTFLELVPGDEVSWLSRGMAQMIVKNPEQALADFQSALDINPRSIDAFQNIATVQAEYLDQTQNAIEALSEIINDQPENVIAIATRGVLYGRLADRTRAHADAKLALSIDSSADTLYRVAGIFALTAPSHERDAVVANDLLRKASLANGRLVMSRYSGDRDLDNIRGSVAFQELDETLRSWMQKPDVGNRQSKPVTK